MLLDKIGTLWAIGALRVEWKALMNYASSGPLTGQGVN
jgi:hypothetical protein